MKLKEKKIKIECKGAGELSLDEIEPFQGELKNLTDANYKKLKNEIIELGFSSPIHIWKKGKKNFILDGHQRYTTLRRMRDSGYQLTKVPVVFVEAKTYKEASDKVLAFTSSYGEMTEDSLKNFIMESNLNAKKSLANCNFPTVNIEKVIRMINIPPVENIVPDESLMQGNMEPQEKKSEGKSFITHICPECGHNFTSKKEQKQ